ncbi:MAG: hypothetical protein J3K34DRAFT_160754 [Monoraphidium minutum]|nr:MAG: hypothetical protein J3K34DRAFT_160754 [Monoraphidium minutum]
MAHGHGQRGSHGRQGPLGARGGAEARPLAQRWRPAGAQAWQPANRVLLVKQLSAPWHTHKLGRGRAVQREGVYASKQVGTGTRVHAATPATAGGGWLKRAHAVCLRWGMTGGMSVMWGCTTPPRLGLDGLAGLPGCTRRATGRGSDVWTPGGTHTASSQGPPGARNGAEAARPLAQGAAAGRARTQAGARSHGGDGWEYTRGLVYDNTSKWAQARGRTRPRLPQLAGGRGWGEASTCCCLLSLWDD